MFFPQVNCSHCNTVFATFFLFLREINFRSCLRGTIWKKDAFLSPMKKVNSRNFFTWFERTWITSKKMKSFKQFHIKTYLRIAPLKISEIRYFFSKCVYRQYEVLYFFRNFREISRKIKNAKLVPLYLVV